jgi:hypothetical protein
MMPRSRVFVAVPPGLNLPEKPCLRPAIIIEPEYAPAALVFKVNEPAFRCETIPGSKKSP